ncbi:AAA-like domain-containing protein [Oribacterium sp. KHPX15]|nr:AAA-like domain-containing protein [Oribacterium sp. KHPX15]
MFGNIIEFLRRRIFHKEEARSFHIPEYISPEDKKKVREIIKKAQNTDDIPRTTQESIPFDRMFQDGICRVGSDYYTKTIQFQDINYQLAQQEDQTEIFEEWCSFLNFFDSSVHFELSFMNMATDPEKFEKSIAIPHKGDGFNNIRDEYTGMLRHQMEAGNNGLTKTKYLTFGIHAESMKVAKPRLIHIETDLLNNFKRLGVRAQTLNGTERLELMHSQFHMGDDAKFHFDWSWLTGSGLNVKDFIAPSSLYFKNGRVFQIGDLYCAMSFLSIDASDVSDRMLADFLGMESSQIVTMHIQSVDQNEAIKTVKHTITELDRSKIDEQKKAVRAGYDMEIIPSDLVTYGKDAKALLKELQSQNERMFLLTFLVMNTGRTQQELETNVFQAASIAQKHNCNLIRLDFQQEQGLMSTLPLAYNEIEIQRGMTTSSTAIFIPFTTQELFQSGNESLYYGLNALSNNLIMVDRKQLKNPNGLILGTPGSGKSFAAKREIANAFLVTDDDVIISDPESEYSPLVKKLQGQIIKISPTSEHYINPMDINMNYSDDDNPIALKADFILSLCELIVGGKEGLKPVEKTVIDRCIHKIYQKYFENPRKDNMPILEDLYNALLEQEEPEAKTVATALEIYVTGSLNVFNHRTNVDITNRLVCYDIKDLGKQLKKIGMLVVQDQVWGRVTENRSQGKSTRYYMDEMHLLLREEQTAAYTVEIWKRFRKWGGIPTGITQNIKDLLASKEVENIFENSDFILMMNQAVGDRSILAKQLNISPHQLSYVTHSGEGEGLLFFGNVILPFVDRFPKDIELYNIMTSKLSEIHETAKIKE